MDAAISTFTFILTCTCHFTRGLTFILEPTDGIAAVRRPYWLYCKAVDSFEVTYLWQFRNENIASDPSAPIITNRIVHPNGTLQIRLVKEEDMGGYTCQASAGGKTILSKKATLTQAYIATTFITNPKNTTVQFGLEVAFGCEINSLPPALIMWRLNGNDVVPKVILASTAQNGGTLVISSARYSDAGEYECVGVNTLLGVVRRSDPGYLVVLGKPQISSIPQNVTGQVGSTAIFNCSAMSSPESHLLWVRNRLTGNPIQLQNSSKISLFHNGTLVLRNITKADDGMYTCLAINDYGNDSVSAHLRITGQPVFITVGTNTTVNVSETLHISCRAQESSNQDAVSLVARWYRGDHSGGNDTLISCTDCSLNPVEADSLRVWTTAVGDLYFQQVLPGDEGWYYCAAGYEGAAVCSSPVFVNVQVLPKIKGITLTPANDQQSNHLICLAVGDPEPYVTLRSPSGQEVRGQVTNTAESVQTVTEIASSRDNGQWICDACNILGCDTATMMVEWKGSPVITDVLSESWETNITITCRALGLPPPEVQYQVPNGTDVGKLPGHTVQTGRMIVAVDAVQESYHCTARNSHGAMSLLLSKPLRCPDIISVTPLAREVTVTFNISQAVGTLPLEALLIDYTPVVTEQWSSRSVSLDVFGAVNSSSVGEQSQKSNAEEQEGTQLGSGIVRAKLNLLMPYTMYKVRARLVNVLGAGPPNEQMLYILTLPDVPSPPAGISVDTSYRSATVSWSAPQHLNGDSGCIVYLIQLFDEWGALLSEMSLPSTHEQKASFYSIDVGKYSVVVMAMNVLVEGVSEAATIDFVITEELPDYVPVILLAKAISHDKVSVAWQIPTNPDVILPPVDGYMVNVSSSSLNTSLIRKISAASTSSATAEGLQQETVYSVTIAAFNKMGIGSYSSPVSVLTHFANFSAGACCHRCSLPPSETPLTIICGCIISVLLAANAGGGLWWL